LLLEDSIFECQSAISSSNLLLSLSKFCAFFSESLILSSKSEESFNSAALSFSSLDIVALYPSKSFDNLVISDSSFALVPSCLSDSACPSFRASSNSCNSCSS